MKLDAPTLAIASRSGLPDPLRTLLEEIPREAWEGHDNFGGLVKFWLERHLMFRKLLTLLREDTEKLEKQDINPLQFQARLSRFGGMFVNELHAHHSIEDFQYFPLLIKMESSLARGFDILDRDHHALDTHLEKFATVANTAINEGEKISADAFGALHDNLEQMNRFLDRHLTDEEELVVPIILRHGFDH